MERAKYRLVTYRGENKIEIAGLGESTEREDLDKVARALNNRFPNRNYVVETVRPRQTERALELVK